MIAFAGRDEEQIIDLIPLSEVTGIIPYQKDERMAEIQSAEDLTINCLKIMTCEDGYNSGVLYIRNNCNNSFSLGTAGHEVSINNIYSGERIIPLKIDP